MVMMMRGIPMMLMTIVEESMVTIIHVKVSPMIMIEIAATQMTMSMLIMT
jgi:hypothetical protein